MLEEEDEDEDDEEDHSQSSRDSPHGATVMTQLASLVQDPTAAPHFTPFQPQRRLHAR